ncbi:MAG: hypothetical protein ACYTEQ_23715, partial [Planctomycetota bacterium]
HQDGLELYEGEFHPQHPAQFMSQRYAGFKVSRFGSHGHLITFPREGVDVSDCYNVEEEAPELLT